MPLPHLNFDVLTAIFAHLDVHEIFPILDAYPDTVEHRYFWVLLHRKLFPEVVVDNSSLEYLRQRVLRGCKIHNTWKSSIIYPTSIQCHTAQRAEFLPDGDTLVSVSADGKPHLIRIGQSDSLSSKFVPAFTRDKSPGITMAFSARWGFVAIVIETDEPEMSIYHVDSDLENPSLHFVRSTEIPGKIEEARNLTIGSGLIAFVPRPPGRYDDVDIVVVQTVHPDLGHGSVNEARIQLSVPIPVFSSSIRISTSNLLLVAHNHGLYLHDLPPFSRSPESHRVEPRSCIQWEERFRAHDWVTHSCNWLRYDDTRNVDTFALLVGKKCRIFEISPTGISCIFSRDMPPPPPFAHRHFVAGARYGFYIQRVDGKRVFRVFPLEEAQDSTESEVQLESHKFKFPDISNRYIIRYIAIHDGTGRLLINFEKGHCVSQVVLVDTV
ncbi:hypothetical protein C8J56DRAFT_85427 [Mycena floridula]|nr:hypothetical protein C8J56DRAFT_85427 [Mycena floridula]